MLEGLLITRIMRGWHNNFEQNEMKRGEILMRKTCVAAPFNNSYEMEPYGNFNISFLSPYAYASKARKIIIFFLIAKSLKTLLF
jgi:hypothetical protein